MKHIKIGQFIWSIFMPHDVLHDVPDSEFKGYVYAVEFGDLLKIGMTTNPAKRRGQLRGIATNYAGVTTGRLVLSPQHTNFSTNEQLLHHIFRERRVGGELFRANIDEFIDACQTLTILDHSVQLELDASRRIEVLKSAVTNAPVPIELSAAWNIVVEQLADEFVEEQSVDRYTLPSQRASFAWFLERQYPHLLPVEHRLYVGVTGAVVES